MIQHQHWEDSIRILVTDEQHYGSIQAFIPNRAEDKPLDGEADALIYSLWVGERHRGREVAKHLMETAERELKRCGIATVAISWDGRFYVVSSLRNFDTTIVCAKRYDAEEQRLYCYAYLWISGRGVYNLHVIDPRGIFKFRDFLGHKPLRIDFDRNPHLIVFEEENISPYLTERDYNDIVQSLQKAGFDWKIEKSEENILGSYKCLLKVNKNKIINTTNK